MVTGPLPPLIQSNPKIQYDTIRLFKKKILGGCVKCYCFVGIFRVIYTKKNEKAKFKVFHARPNKFRICYFIIKYYNRNVKQFAIVFCSFQ